MELIEKQQIYRQKQKRKNKSYMSDVEKKAEKTQPLNDREEYLKQVDGLAREYRNSLATSEQKMQEEYDKTVITLSGGALGISFAFVKDVIGSNPIQHKSILMWCWIVWGLSVTTTLASYFFSHLALRNGIEKLDEAIKKSKVKEFYGNRVGGKYSLLTSFLNAVGGLLFLTGIILITIFIYYNLGVQNAN